MVWGIKDEYFDKVYGNSYKPRTQPRHIITRPKTEQQEEQENIGSYIQLWLIEEDKIT